MQQKNSIRWENDLRNFQHNSARSRRMIQKKQEEEIKRYETNRVVDKTAQDERRNHLTFSSKTQALDTYLDEFLHGNNEIKESSKENTINPINFVYESSPKPTQLRMSLMKDPLRVQVDSIETTTLHPSQRQSSSSPLTKIMLEVSS
jgi:hypothetical protein